jgi:hypothetical protein
MAGEHKTSTIELIIEALLLFCSKPKLGTVLVVTPRLNGHLLILTSLLLTDVQFCSIYLAKGFSLTMQLAKRSGSEVTTDRFLVKLSWVHGKSHLMVRIIAGQMQIMIVIKFHSIKMAKICSQTKWTDGSQ